MSGLPHPSTLQKPPQSPYLFLDIHDTVIQGLIHFTRRPEIGHSPFDTFDLWLHILTLGFPREQGYYTKFYHESPPKPDKEKTLFDEGIASDDGEEKSEEDEDEDGSGGIMIEVWKVEGYYARVHNGGNVWVTTKNEVVLLLFCHASSWDTIDMPISRLKKELRENVIQVCLMLRAHTLTPLLLPICPPHSLTPHPLYSSSPFHLQTNPTPQIHTPLQIRLLQKCKALIPSTPTQKGIHTAIACGSSIRMFKWKINEPEWFFCHVNWHVDLGSGIPSASAKAVETFVEGIKGGKWVK